jgi:hypothetical protein
MLAQPSIQGPLQELKRVLFSGDPLIGASDIGRQKRVCQAGGALLALPHLVLEGHAVQPWDRQARPGWHQTGGSQPGGADKRVPFRWWSDACSALRIRATAFCQSAHRVNLINGVC